MAIKEYIELSKIINIENGITKLPKNYKINGKYEFLDYKTVYKRESINDNFEFQKINIFNKNLNMYKNNYWNLIFTWSSETNNDIFYGTYINTHKKFIVNGFCKILKVIDTSYSPKWLCWYINYSKNVQAVRESILYTTRCNMKKKYLDDIKIPKINIFAQQQIIDIIEPKEKLFLKYHNIVDISNIDNFKKTWSILIDIIEPFENIKINLINKLKILNNISNILINKYNKKELMINNCCFIKGKTPISTDFVNYSKIPFINVSAINNNINKYLDENKYSSNVNYGDVILSLDGTVGIVNNFIYGYNGYGYKVVSDNYENYKLYYSLKHTINQNIIINNTLGSVIKHANKSKNFLYVFWFENEYLLSKCYKYEILIKKQILVVEKIINLLISNYII